MFERIIQSSSLLHGLPLIGRALAKRRYELDRTRSRIDVPQELVQAFDRARSQPAYGHAFEEERPLVTVCVGTYNRGDLLITRCLRSLQNQTYTNIEIIVVGDCCTDQTADGIASLRDERIKFVNLPERGPYPTDPKLRWMVAGTMPVNHALTMAKGLFITHLDDDDEHSPHRIEVLLDFVRRHRADLVFHPFQWERSNGRWRTNNASAFRHTQVTTSSVFYHNWLRRIPWDIQAHRYREPGDWNRFRKIEYLGAKVIRYPESLLRHYKERSQASK